MSHPSTAFGRDTAITALGGQVYEAEIHPSWWIVDGPNGGYLAAIVLRAMMAESTNAEVLQPERPPRSITVQYLSRPVAGAATVEVSIDRRGGAVSFLSAEMRQESRTIARAIAVFAVGFDAVSYRDIEPPEVPAPEELPETPFGDDRGVPMREHYDFRPCLGPPPFSDGTEARTGGWIRLVEPEPTDEVLLTAYADAWLPAVFSRFATPLGVPTLDLTIHFRGRPADPGDWSLVEFTAPVAAEGFLVEEGRIWSREGVLLAESRQLALLR